MTSYAHSTDLDKSTWQTVQDHLYNTARLTLQLGEGSKISDFAYLAALLHDIGKYSRDFQRKLNGAPLRVDHSTAGAQEIKKLFPQNPNQQLIATLLSYCISGHHGGLPDFGSVIDDEWDSSLLARLRRTVRDYQDYSQEIDLSKLVFPLRLPIRPIKNYMGFSLAFFTRMVYSLLVDADFLETETFYNGGRKPRGGYASIQVLDAALSRHLERFDHPTRPIDERRTATLKACLAKAAEKPGLFTLTVPTGGGKTLSSLTFALKHAALHGLKRIIYVIPYTSIIEQNAAVFKECLGDENVLEHHSNFDWDGKRRVDRIEEADDQTDQLLEKLKLAAENWDIPVVVTTNVQFFESLYSNRPSRCRKIHRIANSVIIFDEAQMLPRDYLKPCLYSVYELVKNYGASAVFCTATQPVIEKFLPAGFQLQELAPDPPALYEFYRRIQVESVGKVTDPDLLEQINCQPQVLCIVNTRKHARGLFSGVLAEGRFHLSTLMCPAHRKETIRTIRQRLAAGQTCRVVSTQILEAGIDVDFPVGYRALAGLDSIIQAAGRVNREGRQSIGTLVVFEPDSAYVKRTPGYIAQGAQVARSILSRYSADPTSLQAVQTYFSELYGLHDERAFDARGILDRFEKGTGEPDFDFKTAAEEFKMIEDQTVAVVIPYNDQAKRTLREVLASQNPAHFGRDLQPYTVNIYDREYQALLNKGLIDTYADRYAVLNDPDQYDAETGLIIPEAEGGDAIFFDG